MTRYQMLAAEIYAYSFDNFATHLDNLQAMEALE
jgi:hypothetical protein